jgi:hypothetical protein
MKELTKFIEWYVLLGGAISQIDMGELLLAKFSDYD